MSIEGYTSVSRPAPPAGGNLADILERVLDKGVVIAGDIVINLLDIELLTIKVRLLIASVDTAQQMGIDWWQSDPFVSSRARAELEANPSSEEQSPRTSHLEERVERLEEVLSVLRPPSTNGLGSRTSPVTADRHSNQK
jgi:hypothetical protein